MTVIWAHPSQGPLYSALERFLCARIWGEIRPMPAGTIMAVQRDGNIIGACLFANYDPEAGVIEMMSASVDARWLSRPVLREMFGFAFGQLGCQAAVLRVDPENARMLRIGKAYGFQRYDIPRLRGRNKAEALLVLGDDEWRSGRFFRGV